jgi:hypothetical protein
LTSLQELIHDDEVHDDDCSPKMKMIVSMSDEEIHYFHMILGKDYGQEACAQLENDRKESDQEEDVASTEIVVLHDDVHETKESKR